MMYEASMSLDANTVDMQTDAIKADCDIDHGWKVHVEPLGEQERDLESSVSEVFAKYFSANMRLDGPLDKAIIWSVVYLALAQPNAAKAGQAVRPFAQNI
ncbi:hypothetical protein DUI87_10037 [Hirundo rustica rustica]|uniref:Uncharacterized protein n=1 Tax=Hirundo rustica rustica TaxID=333673 RepID=A0A3M0KZE0_HIRRU|nr:hypothetical protein DUI87_10037 [Hirundo rustica rustica]